MKIQKTIETEIELSEFIKNKSDIPDILSDISEMFDSYDADILMLNTVVRNLVHTNPDNIDLVNLNTADLITLLHIKENGRILL